MKKIPLSEKQENRGERESKKERNSVHLCKVDVEEQGLLGIGNLNPILLRSVMYVISVALVHGDRDDGEGEAAPDRRYLERLRQAKSGLSTPGPEDRERERERERERATPSSSSTPDSSCKHRSLVP
jgi:hypothetical protein